MSAYASRPSFQLTSSYALTYDKLFAGTSPAHISSNHSSADFWSNLLSLDVEHEYLEQKFRRLSKDECLDHAKPFLNSLFSACLNLIKKESHEDVRKAHAIETLFVYVRCLLAKNLAGWEVMEIFAGGVDKSDAVFMNFVETTDLVLGDDDAPAIIRHQILQLSVIFMCSIAQLSPGAYFLRRDLFPSISKFIKSPGTEQFTFEAALLLSLLSNFHKSAMMKLNPYGHCIRSAKDEALMRKLCWASGFAVQAAVKAYQDISDDSQPTFATAVGNLLSSLRPDRALATKPLDPPRELFKNQPIEAAVILLPVFEFVHGNPTFNTILINDISAANKKGDKTPLPFTILTLSSYLLTHASSMSSPRAIAYANLSLAILLAFAENDHIMNILCPPAPDIRLCRQRLPTLPPMPASSRPVSALLNCCVLWLRHNLHIRLEVSLYITCIRVCHRTLWFLQRTRTRLEHNWSDLWNAILGLLSFLASKFDNLITTGGIEQLISETVSLLNAAVTKSETILSSPQAIHELIYELVRSSAMLRKQTAILRALSTAHSQRRALLAGDDPKQRLSRLLVTVDFYEEQITKAGAHSAKAAMHVVAKQIEADGLYGVRDEVLDDLPRHSTDVISFIRYACVDGLALMP